MIKKELRQAVLTQMRQLSKQEKAAANTWLTQCLLASEAYQKAQVLATYLPLPHEFDTGSLIRQAQADGKQILVPKTYGQGRMVFVAYDERALERTSFGLLEPISQLAVPAAQIDLIHVPGLLFNRDHYRIGYGGGYYDRYLAGYEGMTVSTIYDFQLGDFAPSPHDQAVKELYLYEKPL